MAETKKAPSLAEVKKSEDAKSFKGVSAAKVEGTVVDEPAQEEIELDMPIPENMVRVKNITKVNVWASNGKMKPGDVKDVSESDAKMLKEKELCIEVE